MVKKLPKGTMMDIDGNIYRKVKIHFQWWMAENLKVTHYRNGDAIPNVTDKTAWKNLVSGAYCNYDNNATNAETYGRLYNWYAVRDRRNIAPLGWHIPSEVEWYHLICSLFPSFESGKMKETGTTHWNSPNTDATNESGFSALPGGYRYGDGAYYYVGGCGYWWSATESYSYTAWNRSLYYSSSDVYRDYNDKQGGFSLRCVRD